MCEWNRNIIIQDIVLAIVINTSATLLGGDPFDHTWYTFTLSLIHISEPTRH